MPKYLLTFLLFITALFSDSNILINEEKHLYDDFKISYTKDKSALLKIADISKHEFSKVTKNNFTLGYTKGSAWFKFDVENRSADEEFIFSLNESFYEIANLYYFDEKWIKHSNGIFTPIKQREVKSSKLSFKVKIPTQHVKTFYIELQAKYAYFGNLTLQKKSFVNYDSTLSINSIYIFLFGILLIIILFNLFLYLKLKEKIYLYYVGYSFFNLIYIINMSGLLVYVGLEHYIYDLHLSAAFMIGFLILFSLEYLKVEAYLKRYYKVFKILAIFFFILGFLVVYSYQPWNKLINNLAGLTCIILIIISVIIYFKGHSQTKYYVFAMMLYFTFVILFTFTVIGYFEYTNITRYGFIIASGVEAIIFSLMLADRYNDMQDETILSQKELIKIKENTQNYLENEVQNRTSDLTKANKKLTTLIEERELLLKEVYHRVKNNFHVIIGMLWHESTKEVADTQKFKVLIDRIKSMSMIHEYLYKSEDLTSINIKEYLENIIRSISASYGSFKIEMSNMSNDIIVEFDMAISIGIIVNEALTNSLKHNEQHENLTIKIELTRDKEMSTLRILDNGSGFDKPTKTEGFGLTIINQFCKKLPDSTCDFTFKNGTEFKLEFKTNPINI